jgi:hypothetical protein
VSNPGATFTDASYRQIIEIAKNDPILQEKLVTRGDLSSAQSSQLLPFMSDELKAQLKPEPVAETFSLLDSLDYLDDAPVEISQSGDEPDEAEKLLARAQTGDVNISTVIARLADQNKTDSLFAFLAGLSGLSRDAVKNAFQNRKGMPIIVICKGLDVDKDAFDAINFLRCEKLLLSPAEILEQMDQFEASDKNDAVAALNILRKRSGAGRKSNAA